MPTIPRAGGGQLHPIITASRDPLPEKPRGFLISGVLGGRIILVGFAYAFDVGSIVKGCSVCERYS
jgi:hypothetical protein